MRLLSRLLVVLAVCLVAIALPAAPAQAQGAYITLSPDHGVPGEEVTVRGYNFTADEWVDIYYYPNGDDIWIDDVKTDDDGYFKITFTVPESCTGDHPVLAEDEEDVDAIEDFDVEPGLTLSPEEGAVGTTVTVEGHGFAEDEDDIELRYYLNGNYEVVVDNIRADEDGWWKRSFLIPVSAKGDHKIDAQGDENELRDVRDATFEVTPGITLERLSGSPGESIMMTGRGFADGERDIKILFDGEEVVIEIRADDTGYWEEDFEVPDMPKGDYSVTADGESTPKEDITALSFEIEPGLVLSPDEGHVGIDLTVTGGGFAANKDVVVMYENSQIETTVTNNKGSFDVSFLVPESKNGARLVSAEDEAENEATAIFTMESDPPEMPELISPPDGDRAGFIGKMRPTFKWSEVSDDSGVYYSLQIAASANITDTGEFIAPLVSKEGIAGTNYTLAKTEGLPYGTYYWIVQAVDGAENESGWTEAYSFKAGILPLWAFIVIIIAIVAGIGTSVYFFVIRKRVYYY
ncbi:MAG: hypothetical protein JSW38_09550 [Dehalococcoidia bacterium]|nr:MAG: hypothetical protein JSW38_09550 [Dehalococcoidia bacterium]